jgi:peptidoglycan/LPS O-acetylase OafA/YrhL
MSDHTMPPYRPYRRLLLMAVLSFLAMYGLMYMMVDRLENVLPNINQVYMAAMMTAPMIIIELLLMGAMYPNKRANRVLAGGSAVLLLLLITAIRTQLFVGDAQLLKSMIPHHAGAILMCEQAHLHDLELQQVCEQIIASQQAEIDWMRAKMQQQP